MNMSNKVIYKYELKGMQPVVELPVGAKIINFESQVGKLFIWCIIEKGSTLVENVQFNIIGTGIEFNDKHLEFIGTTQQSIFMWHLFKVI